MKNLVSITNALFWVVGIALVTSIAIFWTIGFINNGYWGN